MTFHSNVRGWAAGCLLACLSGGAGAATIERPAAPVAESISLGGKPVSPAIAAAPPTRLKIPGPLAYPSFDEVQPLPIVRRAGPMVVIKGLDVPTPDVVGTSALPLSALVDANSTGDLDEEGQCLAVAVYFESKGEPLEGQLAVAQVVMNRAHSGRFPATFCGVVRQHKQFSFVRRGAFPKHDTACSAWRRASAIARIAQHHLIDALPSNVLWYHADYVAPRWRAALVRAAKIGQHIFYRT